MCDGWRMLKKFARNPHEPKIMCFPMVFLSCFRWRVCVCLSQEIVRNFRVSIVLVAHRSRATLDSVNLFVWLAARSHFIAPNFLRLTFSPFFNRRKLCFRIYRRSRRYRSQLQEDLRWRSNAVWCNKSRRTHKIESPALSSSNLFDKTQNCRSTWRCSWLNPTLSLFMSIYALRACYRDESGNCGRRRC